MKKKKVTSLFDKLKLEDKIDCQIRKSDLRNQNSIRRASELSKNLDSLSIKDQPH
ncbi:hypothetical protein PVE99_26325 [Priestia megaterium]|uniref:Uncharacterized protein n=2 Tax=Priestia megaterium TaxID=1404 RepID=A0ABD4X053_PRIMG|nr:hypothetical protein [Priestia megaterium]MDD9785887.1 hypothetical protein [Priestia megaterium]